MLLHARVFALWIAPVVIAVWFGLASSALADLVYETDTETGCPWGSLYAGPDGQLYLLCRDFEVKRYSADLSSVDSMIPDFSVNEEPGYSRAASLAVRADGYVALGGYLCEIVDSPYDYYECVGEIPYAVVVDPSGETILEFLPQAISGIYSYEEIFSVAWQGDDLLVAGSICVASEADDDDDDDYDDDEIRCAESREFATRIRTDGEVVWDIDLPHDQLWVSWPMIVTASDDRAFVLYEDSGELSVARLIGVDATGVVEWSRSWPNENPVSIESLPDGTLAFSAQGLSGSKMRGINPSDGGVVWEWDAGPEYAVAPDNEFYTVDGHYPYSLLTRRDANGTPYWELSAGDLMGTLGIPACRGVVYLQRSDGESSVTTRLIHDLGGIADSETFVGSIDFSNEGELVNASLATSATGDIYVAPTFGGQHVGADPGIMAYTAYLIRYRVTDDPGVSCSLTPSDDDADTDIHFDDDGDDDDGDDDGCGC